jgi:putative DNA methylase
MSFVWGNMLDRDQMGATGLETRDFAQDEENLTLAGAVSHVSGATLQKTIVTQSARLGALEEPSRYTSSFTPAPTPEARLMATMVQYPKRLIEIDLPIKRISAHARREKSIRHGHISTLHIWWARRPLAACRAVMCASLWLDPVDELCPESFRVAARTWMQRWGKEHLDLVGEESFTRFNKVRNNPALLEDNLELRKALLDFIADFANWDNSTQVNYLETSRALTQAAHEAIGGEPGTQPLVVDPFAGGGAIPLEALRVGADAFASDLNPVAVLLNKVTLEYIPRYGQKLADEVRKWGTWVREQAERELAEFYPKDSDGSVPIAYLWSRTIISEAPDDGTGIPIEVPLLKSLWLSRKNNQYVALRWIRNDIGKVETEIVDVTYADGKSLKVQRPLIEIFHPKSSNEVEAGTVSRGSASCPVTGFTTPVTSVRRQMKDRRGGASDARLFCVVLTHPSKQGRFYRLPVSSDFKAIQSAIQQLERLRKNHVNELSLVPDEPTPLGGGSGAGRAFSQRNYGMNEFADLFTPRQLLVLATLTELIQKVGYALLKDYDSGTAIAIQTILGLGVSKSADIINSLCTWQITMNRIRNLFTRQAISMAWDFAETSPIADAAGDYKITMKNVLEVLERDTIGYKPGLIEQCSATNHLLPNDAAQFVCTDPPYYDAVPYSDLSDFFYVWLKRTLPRQNSLFSDQLAPKSEECIVDETKGKNRLFFEKAMAEAMSESRRILAPTGIGLVVFAHKSTAGWEAQLQAMIEAGWTITGSWSIDTEMETRLRARDSAALASSVHLVCRPRENPDGTLRKDIGDWRGVLKELPIRIHDWMSRLASEGIVGADAIFACLGPALEIFSRYANVEKANGEPVSLKEYLEQVWATVSQEALNMIFQGSDTTGLEEDARLTAMWLWTLSTGDNGTSSVDINEDDEADDEGETGKNSKLSGYTLEFDAARKIAQGLGAHLEKLPHLIQVKGDKAQLLPVKARAGYLFGKEDPTTPPTKGKAKSKKKSERQLTLSLTELETVLSEVNETTPWEEITLGKIGNTVLDRIHQSMILFASGRSEALKRFLTESGIGQDQRFWQLAQSLSALYPNNSEEKRWVDGLLARKKGLGF